ncbi:MAG: hypothetical protein PVH41_17250 [Anaerolineae bacterium]|jgi:hypothetical protein
MGDVTAVVLTLGEETTERALSSVARQSLPPKETIVVENTRPFHAALNAGAYQVRTAHFVQVDADMVLDPPCFQMLRACMAPNVGVVAGHLRDPLIGRACCVKMFRRACFDVAQFKDSISPDTDFHREIAHHGWSLVYALRYGDEVGTPEHTFGEHRPSYTPEYAFHKHLMEGSRYRYRGDLGGLLWHLGQLCNSKHDAALLARIAMSHGVFEERQTDRLGTGPADTDTSSLVAFLMEKGGHDGQKLDPIPPLRGHPKEVLGRFVALGIDLREQHAPKAFERCMQVLHQSDQELAWVASLALCHGLLTPSYDRAQLDKDYRLLGQLLPQGSRSETTPRGIHRLLRLLQLHPWSERFRM